MKKNKNREIDNEKNKNKEIIQANRTYTLVDDGNLRKIERY